MYLSSMVYDVKGVTQLEIRRINASSRFVALKSAVFTSLLYCSPRHLFERLAHLVASGVLWLVNKDITRTRAAAVAFRAIKADLLAEIQRTGVMPDEAFTQKLDRTQAIVLSAKLSADKCLSSLEKISPAGRLALGFANLSEAQSILYGAVYQVRLVAIGAADYSTVSWAQEMNMTAARFRAATAKVADLDGSDIDPDILALATEAAQVPENLAPVEPDWARRLSRSATH